MRKGHYAPRTRLMISVSDRETCCRHHTTMPTSATTPAAQTGNIRQSQFELLRIIAITMIVCGHFLIHSLRPVIPYGVYATLMPLCIDGVNIFFLISGWFGIRFSIKSLFRLVILVIGFASVGAVGLALCGHPLSLSKLSMMLFFPAGQTRYWFIAVYIMLMILSPVLNGGLKAMTPRALGIFIAILTIFNIYEGWIGHNFVNKDGYNVVHAIWMYSLAYWLRTRSDHFASIPRHKFLITFVIMELIMIIMVLITHKGYAMEYNGIFTVVSAAALLLYFSRRQFTNAAINRLATAALGCYLLQDGFFGHSFFYSYIREKVVWLCDTLGSAAGVIATIVALVTLVAFIWLLSYYLTIAFTHLSDTLYARLAPPVKACVRKTADRMLHIIQ